MKIVNPTPPLSGFRNRIRNGTFAINQRGVSGPVTLAAGAYGHDGVKAGAGGATYTFAMTGIDTVLTITAGTLILPIEAGLIEGGAYTLSYSGTSTARVYQGAASGGYTAGSRTVTGLTAATATFLEFSAGSIGLVQFEPGPIATPFERRPIGVELMLCQRYFQKSYTQSDAPGAANTTTPVQRTVDATTPYGSLGYIPFKTIMRAAPSIVLYNPKTGSTAAASNGRNIDANTDLPMSVAAVTDAGLSCLANNTSIPAGYTFGVHFTASAEL